MQHHTNAEDSESCFAFDERQPWVDSADDNSYYICCVMQRISVWPVEHFSQDDAQRMYSSVMQSQGNVVDSSDEDGASLQATSKAEAKGKRAFCLESSPDISEGGSRRSVSFSISALHSAQPTHSLQHTTTQLACTAYQARAYKSQFCDPDLA